MTFAKSLGMSRKKALAKIAPTEHQSQSMLMQRVALSISKYPELALLFAIPNFAGHHGSWKARMASGKLAKAEGRKAGVPDLCLPVSRGPYHALYIEMKRPGKKPTDEQAEWHLMLGAQGNWVRVCFSDEEAWEVLLYYLTMPVMLVRPTPF